MRVGIGYDIHALVEGKPFILGGVRVAHLKGLSGHSDGDVLYHAIVDALSDPGRLERLGTKCQEHVLRTYTWERAVDRMLDVIDGPSN